jgi:hypothetical protein
MRTLFFQHEGPCSDAGTATRIGPAGAPYRLYVLDRFDGRVRSFHEIDAKNDAVAVKTAERVRSIINPMVLWSRTRKVRQWDAPEETASVSRLGAFMSDPSPGQRVGDSRPGRDASRDALDQSLHRAFAVPQDGSFTSLLRAIDAAERRNS